MTPPLLSFRDCQRGGQAIYDRWSLFATPPLTRDDFAWADLFRAGYEEIRKEDSMDESNDIAIDRAHAFNFIAPPSRPVLIITKDGEFILPEGVTATEAAIAVRQAWEQMRFAPLDVDNEPLATFDVSDPMEGLKLAGRVFRAYEQHHRDRIGQSHADDRQRKVDRNAAMAAMCERLAAQPLYGTCREGAHEIAAALAGAIAAMGDVANLSVALGWANAMIVGIEGRPAYEIEEVVKVYEDSAAMSAPPESFLDDLQRTINRWSIENQSNTPDFILAEFVQPMLTVLAAAINRREEWYGRKTSHIDLSSRPVVGAMTEDTSMSHERDPLASDAVTPLYQMNRESLDQIDAVLGMTAGGTGGASVDEIAQARQSIADSIAEREALGQAPSRADIEEATRDTPYSIDADEIVAAGERPSPSFTIGQGFGENGS